jgi:hypothetical protein
VTRLLVALLCLGAAPLAAQRLEVRDHAPGQWLTSYIPFVAAAPNDGPTLEWRMRHRQMADYADRVTHARAFSLRAGASIRGSWFGIVRADLPRLGDGWRVAAELRASSDARWGYYGLGNTTGVDREDAAPGRFDVRRTRYLGYADVTRRVAGPLQVAVGAYGTIADFAADDGSLFDATVGASLLQREASLRAALVLDLRDREFLTRRGLLAEVGYQAGVSEESFGRWYGVVRGWVAPTRTTVVAARALAADLTGTPTLEARLTLPTWETTTSVLGGEESHRGLPNGRFAGRGVLATNLEVRQAIVDRGDYGAAGVVLFGDAGRVFEDEDFRLTFDDWTVGGGAGIWARVLRNNVFVFTVGAAEGRPFVGFRSGWAF